MRAAAPSSSSRRRRRTSAGLLLEQLVGGRRRDDEVGLARAQAQLDRAGRQLARDLIRGSRERIEQHQPDRRLERSRQALGERSRVLAARVRGHGELAMEVLDVRRQVHGVSMTPLWHHFNSALAQTSSSGGRYRAAVRIATWNVNSVKQRLPRLLPWLDERQPDVVCLQETKLADDKLAELLGAELDRSRLRGRGARRGGVERRGDPLARRAGRRGRGTARRTGLPASGGARGGCDVRRRPGGLGLRAERPHPGLGSLPVQARLAGLAARAARGRAGGDGRVRRHEHRADR